LVFVFVLVFAGLSVVVPVHLLKRKGRLKPATHRTVFLIGSGCAVKIP
jgi:hypothetical protein